VLFQLLTSCYLISIWSSSGGIESQGHKVERKPSLYQIGSCHAFDEAIFTTIERRPFKALKTTLIRWSQPQSPSILSGLNFGVYLRTDHDMSRDGLLNWCTSSIVET
jgi:hypothetical protein